MPDGAGEALFGMRCVRTTYSTASGYVMLRELTGMDRIGRIKDLRFEILNPVHPC
jgi:hypothetical protein